MKRIKLIGLSLFLVGVLAYNISTLSNTSDLNINDLSSMVTAMASGGEGSGGAGSTCYYNVIYTGELADSVIKCLGGGYCATYQKSLKRASSSTGNCIHM